MINISNFNVSNQLAQIKKKKEWRHCKGMELKIIEALD